MLVARSLAARLAVSSVFALFVLVFLGVGIAQADFEFEGAFGPDGTSGTEFFVTATSVAVDEEEGLLYVLDRGANALYKFDLEGNPVNFGGASPNVTGNELSGLSIDDANSGERQVAVSPISHVIYLTGNQSGGTAKSLQAFQADGKPAIFSATGTNELTGFNFLQGVAVDETGDIYVADAGGSGKGIQIYAPSGNVIVPSLGAVRPDSPANIAVDSKGILYVLRNYLEVSKYVPSQYPVTASTTYAPAPELVDPNQAHGVAIDRGTSDLYVAESSPEFQVASFDEEGESLGTFGGPGEDGELGSSEGVAAGTANNQALVFVPDSPNGGTSQVKIFKEAVCACKPTVEATSVSDITSDSATLRAGINPNNLDTTYWFEYGTTDCGIGPCFKAPAQGELIEAGKNEVAVHVGVVGLQPNTEYQFRAVAENSEGLTEGSAGSFTTQGLGLAVGLGDARAWELVSPVNKFGGAIVNTESTVIQAATTDNKLAYASFGSIVESPTSNRVPEPATNLAERGADGSWATKDLTPVRGEASQFLHGQTEFKIFTPELLQAGMEAFDNFPLSPEATERTPYLWSDGNPETFAPLVKPSNVPPGTEFGTFSGLANSIRIVGATPDLSEIAISSTRAALVTDAEPESIYLWSDGSLEAVSELPGGTVVGGALGSGRGSVRHAISDDGSRIFWTSSNLYNNEGIPKAGLYLRDRDAGESVRLDIEQSGASGLGDSRPAFNGASADGRVVFFTDTQQLTEDASLSGRDLYRCEIGPVEGGGLGCVELTDISAPILGSGESTEVLDQVSGLSEDGSRLFFVARGVLDEDPNDEGETAVGGQPNLYYWQEGAAPRFVASLSKEDHLVWGEILDRGYTVNISATISPNGRFFAFTSEKSLTGYESRNTSGALNTEVFLYDSEADELGCLSCNPSGAAAVGEKLPSKVAFFPPDRGGLWANRWVAATLPEATQTEAEGSSLYRPRSVLDNGRVFFNAVDPLVQADSNGDWDVYQYEPVGVGSCVANTNSGGMTRSGSGCVGLMSSGRVEGDSGFLDATPSGEDVFFLTKGRLSVLDRDDEVDVYDARVNGVTATVKPVQECTGNSCQPAVAAPVDPEAASQSFNGNEAPVRCGKNQRKVRKHGKVVCVPKKKHHKKRHHKPAGTSRRAHR
ncbi:MAG TPA: hypothetical protein VLK37_05245 [Solirubrobacterales bacterium]|nr:hypothetical protein [Solirubrobacterales bacterium]